MTVSLTYKEKILEYLKFNPATGAFTIASDIKLSQKQVCEIVKRSPGVISDDCRGEYSWAIQYRLRVMHELLEKVSNVILDIAEGEELSVPGKRRIQELADAIKKEKS